MTEIAHELREYAFDAGSSGCRLADVPAAILDAAANEIERLRIIIARLGSSEAFDVSTSDISDELKMRMDYARAAIQPCKRGS